MLDDADTRTAQTPHGPMEYLDRGSGSPVLFVHGSPGGCDQGELMTRFLVQAGHRVIIPSRPGYLGTALDDDNATPDAQADMEVAVLDALGIDEVGLMCWSGGGPSAYRLAARHAERVSALVAVAAVSKAYSFAGGHQAALMEGRVGHWLIGEMARHEPKALVKSTVSEEGDLTKAQLTELVEHIWQDETARAFVLDLAGTVAGRTTGLDNDKAQFPKVVDLGLAAITAPTLLVHGSVDTDVPPEHSEFAASRIAGAELLPVEAGTHIAAWTDPTSDAIQARIVDRFGT